MTPGTVSLPATLYSVVCSSDKYWCVSVTYILSFVSIVCVLWCPSLGDCGLPLSTLCEQTLLPPHTLRSDLTYHPGLNSRIFTKLLIWEYENTRSGLVMFTYLIRQTCSNTVVVVMKVRVHNLRSIRLLVDNLLLTSNGVTRLTIPHSKSFLDTLNVSVLNDFSCFSWVITNQLTSKVFGNLSFIRVPMILECISFLKTDIT